MTDEHARMMEAGPYGKTDPADPYYDPYTMETDLCGVPIDGYMFTCSPKADNETSWSCTGHAHRMGQHIRCTCGCHTGANR